LRQNPNFTYRGGLVVEKFTEVNTAVRVQARNMSEGRQVLFEGSALFLAAGTLSSTRLFLESVEAYDHALTLNDSQYFLLPLLRYRGATGVCGESLHTLAQVFLEIFDEHISAHNIHLQIYTYNELFKQAVQSALGILERPSRFLQRSFLERFLLIQG